MKQKVVVFSQIDTDIQNKLEQNYQVSYIPVSYTHLTLPTTPYV